MMNKKVSPVADRDTLLFDYRQVRAFTEILCEPLAIDDFQIQSIPQTSPPKWHIAHVTWFFETFVLMEFDRSYKAYRDDFDYIFNSYYHTHGKMHPRPMRGLLSRPTVNEIFEYRHHVDQKISALIENLPDTQWDTLLSFWVISSVPARVKSVASAGADLCVTVCRYVPVSVS